VKDLLALVEVEGWVRNSIPRSCEYKLIAPGYHALPLHTVGHSLVRLLLISLAVVVALPVVLFLGLLVTGTIAASSLSMMLNAMLGLSGPAANEVVVAERYSVPEGFILELYSTDVPQARFLRFTSAGDLLVSRPHAGDVVLLRRDTDEDGYPDGVQTVLGGLSRPQGMDFMGDWLYIAESHRVGRIRFDAAVGRSVGEYEPVVEGLTDDGNHWSKTVRFGPDGKLYLAQGSTCNVCEEADARRATMMRFAVDGSGGEILATGLRNSVGFDWAPWDGGLYATDNGRDLLGDDFPVCELNRIEPGAFYGWPYFNGDNVADPDMGADPLAHEREPIGPVHGFRAHNAPLGIVFPDTAGWPDAFKRSALVALHGSWNRSSLDGYKVVSLHWSDAGIKERDFLTGFMIDGDASGRPVDVAQGPDGAIYVSDDYAGAIYRVHRGARRSAAPNEVRQPVSRLDDTPPVWLASADIERLTEKGAGLYLQHGCASCHEVGENAVLLSGLAQRLGYRAVDEVLSAPPPPMPVLPFSEDERRSLAVFLLACPDANSAGK